MKIVIDISEIDYKMICQHYSTLNVYAEPEALEMFAETRIYNAIFKGTPLPDDAIIIDAKEQSDYVFIKKAKYNDLVEAASKALTDRIKKSLYEGGTDDSEDIPMEYFESGGC